ncbi:5'-nucleotidase C-terminal domain-containing protein [Flagellimonas sp. HMM57]|uniref:5'-nucleotidase C-terminal domain-containing protein n=1 Tax=unclassified Flagellimonas TaxID=2644544 RepID=UPI001F0B5EA7|nr:MULTISPECIES: 5'-nucleotidase [unclassified Flagellimonas]UII75590.1 5'-nucleotidase C-terminal domain-containing protein [Flagellimonas sp. HMM57]
MISCKNDIGQLSEVQGKQVKIDTNFKAVDSIVSFVAPYRNRINEVLDSTLAYAPKSLLLDDGAHNTSLGNLIADIVLTETKPVFKSQTGKNLDFVVINRGGLRSIISSGNVTARHAYEVMPFENYISVVKLSGSAVRELIGFLTSAEREHPIAGMQIVLDKKGALDSVNINGSPFDESRSYYVATSDYLVQGGAEIGFFKTVDSVANTDYLLRNAIIDHLRKVDTLKAIVDDRFIQQDY